MEIKHKLSLYLSAAVTMDELSEMVQKFLQQITPVIGIAFMDCSENDESRELKVWKAQSAQLILPTIDSKEVCQICFSQRKLADTQPLMEYAPQYSQVGSVKCYFLSLEFGKDVAGVILLYLPKEHNLTAEQSLILQNLSAEIAAALIATRHRQELRNVEIANTTSAERLEIARDLHDTLGQNLGYLHFKLDQILTCPSPQPEADLPAGLSQLRDLASESYELVRETLVILHRDSQHSLEHFLHVQAQQIADRAGFQIAISEHGEPQALPPRHLRPISFVIKEIMRNIEKHALASQVDILLNWEPARLTVEVNDDGCGFDQQANLPFDHFGLKIMKDRVEATGGGFELASAEGQGTRVKFWIPV
jgi:nitrate/nitrite-specific signal transduction histidine kinase